MTRTPKILIVAGTTCLVATYAHAQNSIPPVVVQNDFWSNLVSWVLTGAIPIILTGIGVVVKSFSDFFQKWLANQQIITSGEGWGAVVANQLAVQGKTVADVDAEDPTVQKFAKYLAAKYDAKGKLAGYTPEDFASVVLKGANKAQPLAPVAQTPSAPVVKSPGQLAYEAAVPGGDDWSKLSSALQIYWETHAATLHAAEPPIGVPFQNTSVQPSLNAIPNIPVSTNPQGVS